MAKTILIVDDSRAMRLIIKRVLRLAGFGDCVVVEAKDGQTGMRTALEMQPDLIVTDWNMPVMNGLEMLESLKAAGYRGSVGFVTTECTADMRIQASQSGASFLISKPFTPDDFQRTLGPILGV